MLNVFVLKEKFQSTNLKFTKQLRILPVFPSALDMLELPESDEIELKLEQIVSGLQNKSPPSTRRTRRT